MESVAEQIVLLREIRDLLRAQSTERKKVGLTSDDQAALEKLLPALNHECGDGTFTVKDLIAYAEHNDELREAFTEVFGPLTASAKQKIGKLFARAAGYACGKYRLWRNGDSRDGALWMVEYER